MWERQPALSVGTLLGERYRVEGELGRGGMGLVLAATDTTSGWPVAVKVLLISSDAQLRRARFMREARVASQLRHPNIVPVLDYSRVATEQPFLVMERVRGRAMAERFERPVPAGVAANLAIQVLRALGHVHAAGVVHRDIKPGNVLLERTDDERARVRLTDFGIARLMENDEADETQLTSAGTVVGTPSYMSPEQAKGAALIGPAADIYAVGICLYAMLAAQLPFKGSALLVLASKVYEPIPAPANLASWPPGLWEVVQRMAATRPEQRHAFAVDAIAALTPFASDAPLDAQTWESLVGAEHAETRVSVAAPADHTVMSEAERRGEAAADAFHESRWRDVWGRREAIARLAACASHVEGHTASLVLVMAEAGYGRTALLTTTAQNLAEDARFQALSADFSSGSPAAALRSALEALLGAASDGPERVHEKAAEWLRQHGETDPAEAKRLTLFLRPSGELASPDGGDALSSQLSLFLRVVRRACARRPVLLLLDDLDRGGVDGALLLERIQLELTYEPMPLWVIASAKDPAFAREVDSRVALAATVTRIDLGPIPEQDLIDGIVVGYEMSFEAARQHARRAGGNPYFARLLAADPSAATALTPSGAHSSGDIPDLLRRIVAGQLDAHLARIPNPDAASALLSRLAVLGAAAPTDLLEALAEDVEADFDDLLDRLIAVGLVQEESDGSVIAFRQHVVREIMLERLSARRAKRLHQRAAALRTSATGGRKVDAAAVARHLSAAGESEAALEWFVRALCEADADGDSRAVLECGGHVLDQLASDDPRYGKCCVALARAARLVGELDVAVAHAERATRAAEPMQAARALELLADFAQEKSDGGAWDAALAALDALAETGDEEVRRTRDRAQLFWLNSRGRVPEALALGQAMVTEAVRFGDEAYIRCRLMWSYFLARGVLGVTGLEGAGREARLVANLPALDAERTGEAKRMLLLHASMTGDEELTHACAMDLVETERRAGRWGRLARAYADAALSALTVEAEQRAIEWVRAARERVWSSMTHFDRRRVELIETAVPFVFGGGEPNTTAAKAILRAAEVEASSAHRSQWTQAEIVSMRLCLALEAATRSDWTEYRLHLGGLDSLAGASQPPLIIERLVAMGLAAEVTPDELAIHVAGAARLLELARAQWTAAAPRYRPRWAALETLIESARQDVG